MQRRPDSQAQAPAGPSIGPTVARAAARRRLHPGLQVDLFCRVIDNYGDAGVCWRLARQLSREHRCRVRLIIDRPEVLATMLPALARRMARGDARTARPVRAWRVEGVSILGWSVTPDPSQPSRAGQAATRAISRLRPADAVIAAFGCDLPPAYRARMRGLPRFSLPAHLPAGRASHWVNLEYLSAEDWVDSHHRLSSPKQDGLTETFFFPGFTPATGGLLRERGLLTRREAFENDLRAQHRLLRDLGLEALLAAPRETLLLVFVFGYPDAPVQALVDALLGQATASGGLRPALSTGLSTPSSTPLSRVLSPDLSPDSGPDIQRLSPALSTSPGDLSPSLSPGFSSSPGLPDPAQDGSAPGKPAASGPPSGACFARKIHLLLPDGMRLEQSPLSPAPERLAIHRIPALPQARFDELLWLCDLTIVRGEDSLVRAVWAGRPMLWQPYPQADAAHLDKLEAFLRQRPPSERDPALAWNRAPGAAPLCETLGPWLADLAAQGDLARAQASLLAQQDDLASQLLHLWRAKT